MSAYWLVKSEPSTWSWQDHLAKGVELWNGVRNPQATRFLKAMQRGDWAFFYHSGQKRQIMGILEVVSPYVPDPIDRRFGMVDMCAVSALPQPVTLAAIKAEPRLVHLALVRQPRLSVMSVDAAAWRLLCILGGMSSPFEADSEPEMPWKEVIPCGL